MRNTAQITVPISIGFLGIAMMALLTLGPLRFAETAQRGASSIPQNVGVPMLVTAMTILIGESLSSSIHHRLFESRPDVLIRAISMLYFGEPENKRTVRKHRKARNIFAEWTRRYYINIVLLIAGLTVNAFLSIFRWWPWYTVLTLAILSTLTSLQRYVLPERVTRLLPRAKKIGLMPTDVILIEMVELAVWYQMLYFVTERYWFRYTIGLTETAARRAEQALIFNRRVPVFNGDVKRLLKDDASRFAETIRSHKIAAARTRTLQQSEQVSDSMCSGIYALAINDWATLASASPSTRSQVNRIKRALPRLVSASLLVAASFLLPLLPQLHEERVQSTSLRIALLVAAVLALVSTSQYATEQVTDVLGRSLRWPSSG